MPKYNDFELNDFQLNDFQLDIQTVDSDENCPTVYVSTFTDTCKRK